MGHHSHSSSRNSHYDSNYYSVPTSYDPAATFTVNDLGQQGYFNGQSMQRSGSLISHTESLDSALNGSYDAQYMYRDNSQSSNSTGYSSTYSSLGIISPTTLYEPDVNYFISSVDTCLSPASNAALQSFSSYSADWMTPRAETTAPYQQNVDSLVSPTSPGMQQNDMQESQPAKYPCLICTQSFARQADLKRHYDHMHSPAENLDRFYCDYKQCLRSEKGSRQAQERMGSQPPSEKVAGIGPFTRKDHFKAHLREQHQEALPKRDPRKDPGWLDGKILKEEWWRCVKCLKRVWIHKQRDENRNEYMCCNCGAPCDQEVLNARQRRFHTASASTSVSTSSRRHKR